MTVLTLRPEVDRTLVAWKAMSEAILEGLDDEELARQGVDDPEALALLYRRHVGGVYRCCFRRMGNREAAEDATHVVFERVIGALPRYQATSTFKAWLFTIAHNVTIDHMRRARPAMPLDDAPPLHDPAPTPEESAIEADERRQLRKLVATLGVQERAVIELRLSGLNDREIAEVLGISHGSVRTRQYRALERLRSFAEKAADRGGADRAAV